MPATIKIDNFSSINIGNSSQLDAEAAAAQANVRLKSTQNLSTNTFVIVGQRGTEKAELRKIQTITDVDDVVLTANLSYTHARFEDFTVLTGDQIQVYRAANVDGTQPADASFSTLGSPITIDPEKLYSSYTDSGGGSDYWYKFTYKNSHSSAETALADSGAARGGSVNSYCSIDDIREEAGFQNNGFITDAAIDVKRQEAQARINSALSGIYTIPFVAPINPLIQQVTRLLAAGYLLLQDYGPMTNMTTDNGQKKVDEAEKILEKLNTKKLVLVDTAGADTSIPGSAGSYSGYPNENTATDDADVGGAERLFRISDRY
jgi:hypothetical protein